MIPGCFPFRNRAKARIPRSLVVLMLGCAGCAPPLAPRPAPVPAGWDSRIVVTGTRADLSPQELVSAIGRADVLFFGEQHDDPETHRVQAMLLEALGAAGRTVVVSLEMFERDAQTVLDDYLAGRMTEADFLAASRPWPRYASDYRPLVERARSRGWPVIAANVPRPLAAAVGRRGLAALDTLSAEERRHAAREVMCPEDDYRLRFLDIMSQHPMSVGRDTLAPDSTAAVAERFYLAQCVKDETMAESIAEALARAPSGAIVVHFNGAFHSDYGQGVVERVRRRAPRARFATVTAIPVRHPAVAPVAPHSGRADFLIFTRRAPADTAATAPGSR